MTSDPAAKNDPETRLKTIEERLTRLEWFLNLARPDRPGVAQPTAPAAPPAPAAPSAPAAPAAAPARIYREADKTPQPTPAPAHTPPQRHSGNWLGVVGVICFVLAAGFIIKLSLDSGWLTPTRQIGLAIVLGLALVVSGLALMGADREYASFLPAAGVIVLYASVFGAHRLYGLLPFESAISLSAMVSGLCVWLYTRIRQDIYPVTAAVGSYFAPAVLGLGATEVFAVYYYLLCSAGFAVISIWVKSRTLTLVAAYLAIMMTALAGFTLKADVLTASLLALNFLVLASGVYLYTVQNDTPLTQNESASLMPAMLFFYAMEYHFIDRIVPQLAPWLSLGFAGLLLVLYLAAKSRFPEGKMASGPVVLAFITVVFFHSFYLELLPRDARPWLFIVIMFALCTPFIKLRGGADDSLRVPAFGLLAVLALELFSMLWHLVMGTGGLWLPVSLFSVGSMWLLIGLKGEELEGGNGYVPLLGAAHLLAVAGLYRLTIDTGSLYVSLSWLIYAVAVISYAFSRKDETLARSAVFVLGFAAGKALLYDASAAPTVVRIICLLLTGAALYGSGFFLRKIAGWKTEKPAQGA